MTISINGTMAQTPPFVGDGGPAILGTDNTSSIPSAKNSTPVSTSSNGGIATFEGEQLQAYVAQQKATYATKPGYEIYFYSRMDKRTAPSLNSPISMDQVPPTLVLTSSTESNAVCPISGIRVNMSVGDANPGSISLFQPKNVNYFQPTIGMDNLAQSSTINKHTTYDLSGKRIGQMDTVVIKLINVSDNPAVPVQKETVFRGVISNIARGKSTSDGSLIDLSIIDFSEFLRRCMAVNNGLFSTLSLSAFGRDLTYNVLRYANNLFAGTKNLGIQGLAEQDVTAEAQNSLNSTLQSILSAIPQGDNIGVTPGDFFSKENIQLFPNTAMDVPPIFALEFQDELGNHDFSNQVGELQQYAVAVGQMLATLLANPTDTSLDPQLDTSQLHLSVEDAEAVNYYTVAPNSGKALPGIQKEAWALSDLYLEKGLTTIEHQYLWKVIQDAANRAMRESFVDFKPKLSANAKNVYNNATVVEQRANKNLPDLHPNVAIVKYRLSPFLIPYQDNNSSQFWHYKFTDDDVMNYQGQESEANLYTHVLAYGFGDGEQSLTNIIYNKVAGEESQLAVATPIDPNLPRRFGYRFLSEHDAKLQFQILRNFVSNVILEKSQLSVFSQVVTLPGRPDIQAGSIVYLADQNTDYYCTDVIHTWSLQGYITKLNLGFGRTHGDLPLAVLGDTSNSSLSSLQCNLKNQLLKFGTGVIGGVDSDCFVEAIWNTMTGGSTADGISSGPHGTTAKINSSNNGPDWITYVGSAHNELDSAILNGIQSTGLSQYNVTPNLLKNFVNHESSWNPSAEGHNTDGSVDYGYFQINFPGNVDRNDITISEAKTNFNKAAQVACNILLGKFKEINAPTNCSGTTFLKAIQAYNGLQPNGSTNAETWAIGGYVNLILGTTQANAIAQGTQVPGVGGLLGENKSTWPYYVYGPCGLRAAQADESVSGVNPTNPTATYNSAKNKLMNFSTGLSTSFNYLTGCLKKYANASAASASSLGTVAVQNASGQITYPFAGLIDGSVLDCAIAEWYSNGKQAPFDPKFDANHFKSTLAKIKSEYNTCKQFCSTLSDIGVDMASEMDLNLAGEVFQCPVGPGLGNVITSPFGLRSLGGGEFHKGIDIDGRVHNQPVYAARDGIVQTAAYASDFGHYVALFHPQGNFVTRYGDLGSLSVQQGQSVKAGQMVGVVGPGPNETGTHLHFEIRTGASPTTLGAPVNPAPLIRPSLS